MNRTLMHHLLASLIMAALLLPACSPLRPYAEVAASLPPERLVSVNDQRVHVERWGDSGPHVVLLHGFAASGYSFRKIGPLLGTSHRVTAIDYNGHGYTERPAARGAYTFGGQLDLISGVLEELGIGEASIVGHSFGGQLALGLATRQPDLVSRLVLISPPTDFGEVPWFLRSGLVRQALYPLVRLALSRPASFQKTLRGAYHQDAALTDEESEQYRQRLLIEGLRSTYFGLSEAMNEEVGDPLRPRVPILVLAGRHDSVVPLDDLQAFTATLPQARLAILQNSGHSSPEEEPEEVAQIVREFFKTPDEAVAR